MNDPNNPSDYPLDVCELPPSTTDDEYEESPYAKKVMKCLEKRWDKHPESKADYCPDSMFYCKLLRFGSIAILHNMLTDQEYQSLTEQEHKDWTRLDKIKMGLYNSCWEDPNR